MKKFALLIYCFVCFQSLSAQELGIRFGDVTGGQVAVDALFSTTDFSMLHADVSFGGGGLGVDVLWDFIYRPLGDMPFGWYAGVGPTVFLGNTTSIAAAAELGIHYSFPDVPISISSDWRPTLVVVSTTAFQTNRFGLNVRYRFGK